MTKYLTGKYNSDCKIFADDVEASAMELIQSILDDEVSAGVPVRIMPDVHAGVDIVIGFTMPLTDRVNPAHIGVDIGCGVYCERLDINIADLSKANEQIREVIPMGFKHRNELSDYIDRFYNADNLFNNLCDKLSLNPNDVLKQLGTLGGGNHFIEVGCIGNRQYLLIHSGSRNFGKQVCDYHCKKAKAQGSKYLFGDDMAEYICDMQLAQGFAEANRRIIMLEVMRAIGAYSSTHICDTIHNYIEISGAGGFRNGDTIIRKGAVRAGMCNTLVIPMNMRDGVLLCTGKGNPDWNYSAPHGAGRVLARNKAKKELSMDSFKEQMNGIYSTSVCFETLDEAPDAYKNMQTIIDAIGDTVEIIDIVKPILNIKALD